MERPLDIKQTNFAQALESVSLKYSGHILVIQTKAPVQSLVTIDLQELSARA